MSGEYPQSEQHLVPDSYVFTGTNSHEVLVLHKTGGDPTVESTYNTFLQSGKSVHYVVGPDGRIWQTALEKDGAGGNCCLESGHDTFWDYYYNKYGNLNFCTLSIEHCDPDLNNASNLTSAQQNASFGLVAYLVKKYGIPLDHIKGHFSLDPQSRAHCPGNYPWNALMSYLQSGGGIGPIPPPSPNNPYADLIANVQGIVLAAQVIILVVVVIVVLIVLGIAIGIVLEES